jgi:hypothetical protein
LIKIKYNLISIAYLSKNISSSINSSKKHIVFYLVLDWIEDCLILLYFSPLYLLQCYKSCRLWQSLKSHSWKDENETKPDVLFYHENSTDVADHLTGSGWPPSVQSHFLKNVLIEIKHSELWLECKDLHNLYSS